MHKRIIMVLTALLAVAALGFAAGQSESPAQPGGELISLEGTIHFADRFWPELEAAGITYRLMAPRYLPAGVKIAEGDVISVEGYAVPGPRMGWQKSDEKYLAVTKAVIGGEEYLVNRPFGHGLGGPACDEDERWGSHHGRPGYGRDGMMRPPMGAPGFGWSQS
jgi:hypothetical protein